MIYAQPRKGGFGLVMMGLETEREYSEKRDVFQRIGFDFVRLSEEEVRRATGGHFYVSAMQVVHACDREFEERNS